jgi:hypothetical protein
MNSLARHPRSSAQGMSGRLAEWISAGLGHIVGVAAALLLLAETDCYWPASSPGTYFIGLSYGLTS